MVLLNLLYIFSTKSSPKPSVSSFIQNSPNLSSPSFSVVWLQIFLFSIGIVADIAYGKSRILLSIQRGVFGRPEALPNHTISKLCCLVHEIYPRNHISFQELVIYTASCPPCPFPESYDMSFFKSSIKNLLQSLYLLNRSFFLCRGFVISSKTFLLR